MKIKFDTDQTRGDKEKCYNYALTLLLVKNAHENGLYKTAKGMAAVYTSCNWPIRYIQQHLLVKAILTKRAIQLVSNLELTCQPNMSYKQLSQLNKEIKVKINKKTPLRWEHIISVKNITEKIFQSNANSPKKIIDLIKEQTYIVIKNNDSEMDIKGEGKNPTTIDEFEEWNNSFV
jgi:hypothetical protein